MKWTTTVVTLLATGFVLGIVPQAHADDHRDCSSESLMGSFGFTSTGFLLAVPPPSAGPFGEIGRQSFDGLGGTEGSATLSANGNIRHVTFDGSYVVNPDCTGTMTLVVAPIGVTVILDFVIDDDGAEIRAIATGTGTIETRVYQKQFAKDRKGK
jgi:hypothetical protein